MKKPMKRGARTSVTKIDARRRRMRVDARTRLLRTMVIRLIRMTVMMMIGDVPVGIWGLLEANWVRIAFGVDSAGLWWFMAWTGRGEEDGNGIA